MRIPFTTFMPSRISWKRYAIKTKTWTFMASTGLMVLGILCLVYVRVAQVQLGYQIAALEKQIAELEEEKRSLTLEVGTLKHPKRISHFATTKLHLVQPTPKQIWHLKTP